MGLNEIGVEILIEELGVEEFAEFVYDISEDYYLAEARAGGVKIEPVTTKGKQFKGGKPTGKSLERLRNKKKERQEGEASERPSGMKAALQRQDAMVSASKQQPKRKDFWIVLPVLFLRVLKDIRLPLMEWVLQQEKLPVRLVRLPENLEEDL